MTREAIVIGAGVVGVTTAWMLAHSGWRVRVIDAHGRAAEGASARNGGQLSYRYLSPLADAGIPLKALSWLLSPDAPLRLDPRARPAPWVWLAAFLSRCNRQANRETVARLAPLGEYSRRCLAALVEHETLPPFGWRRAGKLVVHRDPRAFERVAAAIDPASGQRALDVAACVALEPAIATLAPRLAGGIHDPDEAVADCAAFTRALLDRLRTHARFEGLVDAEATGLGREGRERTAVHTREGRRHVADVVVLAAGTGSRALLATATGGRATALPVLPLKGYSLTLPIGPGHVPPSVSVTDFERKILYARIGHHVRIAAMVDLAGEDATIDPRRLATLQRLVREDMPEAGDLERAEPWAGLRPATPDGAPRIGRGPWPGLWLNAGHGGLGFTLACGSAAWLAHRLGGTPPAIPTPDFDWPDP